MTPHTIAIGHIALRQRSFDPTSHEVLRVKQPVSPAMFIYEESPGNRLFPDHPYRLSSLINHNAAGYAALSPKICASTPTCMFVKMRYWFDSRYTFNLSPAAGILPGV